MPGGGQYECDVTPADRLDKVDPSDSKSLIPGRVNYEKSEGVKLAMIRSVKFVMLSCLLGLASPRAIISQARSAPEGIVSLDKYDITSFCISAGSSPDNIIKLDNNGQILLACISGRTVEQLRTLGVQFTKSQIELLKNWRLLREDRHLLKTAFPILNEDKTKQLRKLVGECASPLSPGLLKDLSALKDHLQFIRRERNTYTILFSYILDGLVWEYFFENKVLKERKLSVEKPFWSGVVWAVYPPRDFSCGTNSVSDQGITLKVNWSKATLKKMIPFVADWDSFSKMFDDLVGKGKIEEEKAIRVFRPFDLFDQSGRFTVPIIFEKENDALYKACVSLSSDVSEEILNVIHLEELKKEFDFRDNDEALVIFYHEFMWALLEQLEGQGLIKKPIAFVDPERAKPEDIGDLVFIVKKGQK